MNRREFIAAAALALPALAAAQASAADAPGGAAAPGSAAAGAAAPDGLDAVVAAAESCLKTARVCQRHCLEMLGRGNTSLKDCGDSVNNVLAACEAMVKIGALRSAPDEDLKAMAKACGRFCRSCEAQCRKHASEHKICADCMDSCAACAKACEAYA
jgi:Cys-rich four helix bundle protein (predicted Tat secretion target)